MQATTTPLPPAMPARSPSTAAQRAPRAGMEVLASPLLGTLIRAAAEAVLGRMAVQAFDPPERVAPVPSAPPLRMRRSPVLPRGTYARLKPAYRYGWESFHRWEGGDFDHLEPELARGWEAARGDADLAWAEARGPVRDAWMRAREAAALGVFGG